MRRLIRIAGRFHARQDGNVAVETAIATPFVLLLLFGAIDIIRYVQVEDAVIRAVSTTADAVGRQNGITTPQLTAFLNHAADTMDPDDTGGSARIGVAAVHRAGTDAPKVVWRRDQDGGANPYSGSCQQTGGEGGAAALPGGFTMEDDETVIISEGCYTFVPAFLISRAVFNLDFVPLNIYARGVSAARFGSLVVLDP